MNHFFSWVCPKLLDKAGKFKSGGCGGNWGAELPDRCPNCGGPLQLMQQLGMVKL